MELTGTWRQSTWIPAIGLGLQLMLVACGGGNNAQIGSDATGEPAALPTINAAGNVVWSDGPQPGQVSLEIAPFAQLPLDSFDLPARLNAFAAVGNQLFVADERDGNIYKIGQGQPQLWFSVKQALAQNTDQQLSMPNQYAWHAGLRSVAFHPAFASNGFFYTSAMQTSAADLRADQYLSTTANPIDADSVLAEWKADPNTMVVDPASYRELFRVGMPVYDHTIKQISFNPYANSRSSDYGLLYIAHGDGSVKSAIAGGGQNNDALGKILRIDPLQSATADYSIPPTNPFINDPGMLDEVWSFGHRNPHHLAFFTDGTLLSAEPGRDNIEEINRIEPGKNYGWSQREGTYVHLSQGGGLLNGIAQLPADDAANLFTYPVIQFGHTGKPGDGFVGQAVGGGYAVENISALAGKYFYAEFATSGQIFYSSLSDIKQAVTQGAPETLTQAPIYQVQIQFDHDADPATPTLARDSMLDVVRDNPNFVTGGTRADIRFGQGPDGTLYLMSKRNGMVYQVTNSKP